MLHGHGLTVKPGWSEYRQYRENNKISQRGKKFIADDNRSVQFDQPGKV